MSMIERLRIVPVVVIDKAADAEALGHALVAGGLPLAEITLRTDAAIDAIRALATAHDVVIGAGTVLTADQADQAMDAGADFVVSPGLDLAIVERCRQRDVPVLPGAATATEVQAAFAAGIRTVKFFPAEAAGGLPIIKALAGPFGDMHFIPTGGINTTNAAAYLRHPAITAIGGSWMASRTLIADHKFDEITRLTAEAVKLVNDI